MTEHGGSYLVLTTKQGHDFVLEMGCLEQLESDFDAYQNQVPPTQQAWTPDKVINLPLLFGSTLRIAIGAVSYFHESTPDSRDAAWEHERSIRERKRAVLPEGD